MKREKEKDLCKRMEEGSANVGEWVSLALHLKMQKPAGRNVRCDKCKLLFLSMSGRKIDGVHQCMACRPAR